MPEQIIVNEIRKATNEFVLGSARFAQEVAGMPAGGARQARPAATTAHGMWDAHAALSADALIAVALTYVEPAIIKTDDCRNTI